MYFCTEGSQVSAISKNLIVGGRHGSGKAKPKRRMEASVAHLRFYPRVLSSRWRTARFAVPTPALAPAHPRGGPRASRDRRPGNPLICEGGGAVLSRSAPRRRARRHCSRIPNILFVCGRAAVRVREPPRDPTGANGSGNV